MTGRVVMVMRVKWQNEDGEIRQTEATLATDLEGKPAHDVVRGIAAHHRRSARTDWIGRMLEAVADEIEQREAGR